MILYLANLFSLTIKVEFLRFENVNDISFIRSLIKDILLRKVFLTKCMLLFIGKSMEHPWSRCLEGEGRLFNFVIQGF